MTLQEARKVLASYLAGGRVDRATLAYAMKIIDRESPRRAAEPQPESGCSVFLEHVAEFAELTDKQRDEEYPELVEHAKDCPSCAHTMEEVRQAWQHVPEQEATAAKEAARASEAAKTPAAGPAPLRLVRPLRLAIRGGRITEQGGPPPKEHETLALAAGPEMPDRREWQLYDQPSGWTLTLIVNAPKEGLSDPATLDLRLEHPGQAADPFGVRVEMRPERGQTVAGSMADLLAEPLPLPRGASRLRVELERVLPPPTFEIPLYVETDG